MLEGGRDVAVESPHMRDVPRHLGFYRIKSVKVSSTIRMVDLSYCGQQCNLADQVFADVLLE